MSAKPFSTEVPGKWVLAGEHTVLRGGQAIALPHPEFRLRLEFQPSDQPLIHELLEVAQAWLVQRGFRMEPLRGILKITSSIPMGAGLGSSAALSVAFARWILSMTSLDPSLERELGREMENRFHGKSSGMDVAVISMERPIRFTMSEGAVPLNLSRIPNFAFIDSGLRASTRDSILKVEAFRNENGVRAEFFDQEMKQATEEVQAGLLAFSDSESSALAHVSSGMRRASRVFAAWGLIPPKIERMLRELERQGLQSPRLTGSGGGGYVVGLKSDQ